MQRSMWRSSRSIACRGGPALSHANPALSLRAGTRPQPCTISFADVHIDQFTGIEIHIRALLDLEDHGQNADIHALLALIRELDFRGNVWLHPDEVQRNLDIRPANSHLRLHV